MAQTREDIEREQIMRELAGMGLGDVSLADQAAGLRQIAERIADGLRSVIEGQRADGGRETTIDACNFTQDMTLNNLKARYGDLISPDKYEGLLKEILEYLKDKPYRDKEGRPIPVNDPSHYGRTTTDVAYLGAEYYSHKSEYWNGYSYWDTARDYTVPQALYLWWCAAKDPRITTSTVENRKKAFLRAMEETFRAHNRDNDLDEDNKSPGNASACRMGFKNKMAECFKEILLAAHPDNVYVADINDYFTNLTRESFVLALHKKSEADRKILRKIWDDPYNLNAEQGRLLEGMKDAVRKRMVEVLAERGIREDAHPQWKDIKPKIQGNIQVLENFEFPDEKEIDAFIKGEAAKRQDVKKSIEEAQAVASRVNAAPSGLMGELQRRMAERRDRGMTLDRDGRPVTPVAARSRGASFDRADRPGLGLGGMRMGGAGAGAGAPERPVSAEEEEAILESVLQLSLREAVHGAIQGAEEERRRERAAAERREADRRERERLDRDRLERERLERVAEARREAERLRVAPVAVAPVAPVAPMYAPLAPHPRPVPAALPGPLQMPPVAPALAMPALVGVQQAAPAPVAALAGMAAAASAIARNRKKGLI